MARRVLIAGPAWVGDMVMTQSLLIALKRRDPEAEIDVLAPAWSLPIIARMPEARRGIELPTTHGELGWGKRRRLGRELQSVGYDRAVVLPRSAKAALVPWFARIPVRTGYRGEFRYGLINDMRPLDKRVLTQTVQRFVALGLPADAALPPEVPYPRLTVDAGRQAALRHEHGLGADEALVALMPGAEYGPAKQWPVAHFGRLAERLANAGLRPVIFGSAGERDLGAAIAAYTPAAANLCGATELVDVVDLLAGCRAAVSNDSGLMHVAAAVGVPLAALYGSSTPAYTPPLSGRAAVLYLGVACSPCFERVCPLGHTQCLTRIGVADVLAALAEDAPAVVK